MSVNNLNQTGATYKVPITNAERERRAAFKSKVKNEQNIADLIKKQEKSDISIQRENVSSRDDGTLSKEELIKAAEKGYDIGVSKLVDNNGLIPECVKSPLKKVSNLIKKPAAELTVFLVKNFDI